MFRDLLQSIGLMLIGRSMREELEAGQRLRAEVVETRHWMSGSFPEVSDAMLHVEVCAYRNPELHQKTNPLFMSGKDVYTGIDQFRERMRNKYHRDDCGNTKMPLMDFTAEEGFHVIHKEGE